MSIHESYYSAHHIRSVEEIYNDLADYIVAEYLRAYPNDNTNRMTVESMVSRLSNDSVLKQEQDEKIAQSVNDNINQSFKTIYGLFDALEKGTVELHPINELDPEPVETFEDDQEEAHDDGWGNTIGGKQ